MDAVERMLEDLISIQENPFVPEEIIAEKKSVPSQPEPTEGSVLYQKLVSETESDPLLEIPEPSKTNMHFHFLFSFFFLLYLFKTILF